MTHGDESAPKPARDQGRFAKGTTGNSKGRPRKAKTLHSMPEVNRRSAFAVAERQIPLNVDGKSKLVTLYEANLLRLATDGARGDRNAARLFVNEVNRAASIENRDTALVHMLLGYAGDLEERIQELERAVPRHGVIIDPTLIHRQSAALIESGNAAPRTQTRAPERDV